MWNEAYENNYIQLLSEYSPHRNILIRVYMHLTNLFHLLIENIQQNTQNQKLTFKVRIFT